MAGRAASRKAAGSSVSAIRANSAGTQVSTPVFNSRWKANEPATVAIEAPSWRQGGVVRTGRLRIRGGDERTKRQPASKRVKGYDGDLIKVTDETGRCSSIHATSPLPRHAEGLRDKFAVYLCGRATSFRIGKCKMELKHPSQRSCARMRHEEADAVWILSLHQARKKRTSAEQAISGRFGLPQLMFSAKKMMRGPAASYLRSGGLIGNNSVNAESA